MQYILVSGGCVTGSAGSITLLCACTTGNATVSY